MEERVIKPKSVGEMYFCSAELRPDNCLKQLSNTLCCVHCDMTSKCLEVNKKSKIKPCNMKTIGMDEYCEYSL